MQSLQEIALLDTFPPAISHDPCQSLPCLPRGLLCFTLACILRARRCSRQVDALLV